MQRKPIQIAMHGFPLAFAALCDDGTIWHCYCGSRWTRVDDIPQPEPAPVPQFKDAQNPDYAVSQPEYIRTRTKSPQGL